MAFTNNIYDRLMDQALSVAMRDGTVDDAERDLLAAIEDMRNRGMAVAGVLTRWTGVPRDIERIQPQPEWLPDLLNATEHKRKSA